MRAIYKNTTLVLAMVLVASIPSAFATSTSYTTYSCCNTQLQSSNDSGSGDSNGDATVYANPDGTHSGSAILYMYNAKTLPVLDSVTLSGISAKIQTGSQLWLSTGGTNAQANINAYLSDPSCSPSYICALSSTYSSLYSHSISSGQYNIPSGTVSGSNVSYTTGPVSKTYDIVGYVESAAAPSSCTLCFATLTSASWGVTNFKITITY